MSEITTNRTANEPQIGDEDILEKTSSSLDSAANKLHKTMSDPLDTTGTKRDEQPPRRVVHSETTGSTTIARAQTSQVDTLAMTNSRESETISKASSGKSIKSLSDSAKSTGSGIRRIPTKSSVLSHHRSNRDPGWGPGPDPWLYKPPPSPTINVSDSDQAPSNENSDSSTEELDPGCLRFENLKAVLVGPTINLLNCLASHCDLEPRSP